MSELVIALVAITLVAAIINGGLGYGFSSITVPLALLFLSNRQLNPALVLIEVALNAYVLWVNRDALGVVWRRVVPIVQTVEVGGVIIILLSLDDYADGFAGRLRLGGGVPTPEGGGGAAWRIGSLRS